MDPVKVPVWLMFVASIVVPFAVLAIGFRLLYDSVLPEVAGLVLTGAVLSYIRPRYAWRWVIGIGLGIILSEKGFPVTPSIEHTARYGPATGGTLIDFVKLCGFPATGAVMGAVSRLMIDLSLGHFRGDRLGR